MYYCYTAQISTGLPSQCIIVTRHKLVQDYLHSVLLLQGTSYYRITFTVYYCYKAQISTGLPSQCIIVTRHKLVQDYLHSVLLLHGTN